MAFMVVVRRPGGDCAYILKRKIVRLRSQEVPIQYFERVDESAAVTDPTMIVYETAHQEMPLRWVFRLAIAMINLQGVPAEQAILIAARLKADAEGLNDRQRLTVEWLIRRSLNPPKP